MASSSFSAVAAILEKMSVSQDKDYIYMALADLHRELNRGLHLDETREVQLVENVLKQGAQGTVEIQELVIKCAPQIIHTFQYEKSVLLLVQRTEQTLHKSETQRQFAVGALKAEILALGTSRFAVCLMQLSRSLLTSLSRFTQVKDDRALLDILDVLSFLFGQCGLQLIALHTDIIGALWTLIDTGSRVVAKQAVRCVGALSPSLDYEHLENILRRSLDGFDSRPVTAFDIINSVVKTAGSRLRPDIVNRIIGLLCDFCDAPRHEDKCEEREACLLALESVILYCPTAVLTLSSRILPTLQRALSYDPNVAEQSDDEDTDAPSGFVDNSEKDEDEDKDNEDRLVDSASEGDYSDDEDASWQVRRAAVKCVAASLQSHSPSSTTSVSSSSSPSSRNESKVSSSSYPLLRHIAVLLIGRLGERQQHIQLEIFSCFRELLQQMRSSHLSPSLCGDVPSLVDKLAKQLKRSLKLGHSASASVVLVKVQEQVTATVADLVQTLPGDSLDATIDKLLSILIQALLLQNAHHSQSDKSAQTSGSHTHDLRLHELTSLVLMSKHISATVLLPHLASLVRCACMCSKSSSPKIAVEACRLCHELCLLLSLVSENDDSHIVATQHAISRVDILCGLEELPEIVPVSKFTALPAHIIAQSVCDLADAAASRLADVSIDMSVKNAGLTLLGSLSTSFGRRFSNTSYVQVLPTLNKFMDTPNVSTRTVALQAATRCCRWELVADVSSFAEDETIWRLIHQTWTGATSYVRQVDRRLRMFSLGCLDTLGRIAIHLATHVRASPSTPLATSLEAFHSGLTAAFDSLTALGSDHTDTDETEVLLFVLSTLIRLSGNPVFLSLSSKLTAVIENQVVPYCRQLMAVNTYDPVWLEGLQDVFSQISRHTSISTKGLSTTLYDCFAASVLPTGTTDLSRAICACVAAVATSSFGSEEETFAECLLWYQRVAHEGKELLNDKQVLYHIALLGELGRRIQLQRAGAAADDYEHKRQVCIGAETLTTVQNVALLHEGPLLSAATEAARTFGALVMCNPPNFLPLLSRHLTVSSMSQPPVFLHAVHQLFAYQPQWLRMSETHMTSLLAHQQTLFDSLQPGLASTTNMDWRPLAVSALHSMLLMLPQSTTTSVLALLSDSRTAHVGLLQAVNLFVCSNGATTDVSSPVPPHHFFTSSEMSKLQQLIKERRTSLQTLLPRVVDVLQHPDVDTRTEAVAVIRNIAAVLTLEFQSLVSPVMRALCLQMERKEEFVRQIDFGPIKKTVDLGLNLRNAVYECVYMLLDTFSGSIEESTIMSVVQQTLHGLVDDNELRVLSHSLLSKILSLGLVNSKATMWPSLFTLLRNNVTVPAKENAVKQELDKHNEMVESAVKCVNDIRRYVPDMDGVEAFQQLEAAAKAVRVSAVSSPSLLPTDISDQTSSLQSIAPTS